MINKSFSLAPVALVLAVVTTTLAASVSQLTAATNEEQIRVQNELISRIQCVDVYKNGKKSIVCGDPLPPTLDILKAKSAVPSFTEQTNNESGQPRTFLNLDYLKNPDPVNVYMQPPQQTQYVPQPQIVLQQPQYVQPQVNLVLSQIYLEQPQVHYVQPPAPQMQYQPKVYQRPQCQPAEQCLPSYGGGGYYVRPVEFWYFPANLMKSVETGDLVQPSTSVPETTTSEQVTVTEQDELKDTQKSLYDEIPEFD